MPIRQETAKSHFSIANKSFDNAWRLQRYDSTKPTIQKIFTDQWSDFLKDPQVAHNGFRDVTLKEVQKMMDCGTFECGFEIYECPDCHTTSVVCYTCKSRFCSSCGVRYAKERALGISANALDVPYRHLVFTIDEELREYFLRDREMLHLLFSAVKDTLFYVFDKINGKKDTFTPGIIMVLHTFGRALNWNPHIHCLITEGGMNSKHIYKNINFINYESLRKSFMRTLLYKMRDSYDVNSREYKNFKKLISKLYREHKKGFYVYAPPLENRKGKDAIINYILRYTGRPVMAQSRIIHYNKEKKTIKYYYEDHKTNERIEVEEHVFLFMKKLLLHIPEQQFKMIRYYGIYATCNHSHKEKMKILLPRLGKAKERVYYRGDLIETFGVDPFLCTCGHYMEFIDYYVPSSKGGDKNGPIYS